MLVSGWRILTWGPALSLLASLGVVHASEKVLYSFCAKPACTDGKGPVASLIRDEAGNLYGTTELGGAQGAGLGTVFKIVPGGGESILHSFCTLYLCGDGAYPLAKLLADKQGNLYGTTWQGGSHRNGAVFRIAPDGTESVLYSFCAQQNCSDGEFPKGDLIADAAGNLYGTSVAGGSGGGGSVFKLAPDGTETVLYSFCQLMSCSDGSNPVAGLIMDKAGNLYGTTEGGGDGSGDPYRCGDIGCGVVFKLAPNGSETVLYSFCQQSRCTDGARPVDDLISDKAGNLYGTTQMGGTSSPYCSSGDGCGMVFKVAPNHTETVLYSFCSQAHCADGDGPLGSLIMDKSGNLYGTSGGGGSGAGGIVFKLAPGGSETVLHNFCSPYCADGSGPAAGVIANKKNELYGTTWAGGAYGKGAVFKLKE